MDFRTYNGPHWHREPGRTPGGGGSYVTERPILEAFIFSLTKV